MYMKFLMTLFIFAACSTAVQSTHRVKTRNCKYFIKATFDRMIAEMTDIKEDITSLKAENSALQREVSDQQEEFNGLKMENTELKMKVIDLEQNNNQSG